MFTTHYTSPTSEMNVRDYDDSILFGSTPLTIVLTKVEALDVIIGMMPFLDDDALSKIALQRIALDDERHPRPDETHVDYPHYPGFLPDCPACEARCHCAEGSAECVYGGEHEVVR